MSGMIMEGCGRPVDNPAQQEQRPSREARYDKYLSFAKTMSKKELNEAYAEAMVELEKYQKRKSTGNNG